MRRSSFRRKTDAECRKPHVSSRRATRARTIGRGGTAAARSRDVARTIRVFTARWLACAGHRTVGQFPLPLLDAGQHGICRRQCVSEAAQICATSGVAAQARHSARVMPRRSRRSSKPVTIEILPQIRCNLSDLRHRILPIVPRQSKENAPSRHQPRRRRAIWLRAGQSGRTRCAHPHCPSGRFSYRRPFHGG